MEGAPGKARHKIRNPQPSGLQVSHASNEVAVSIETNPDAGLGERKELFGEMLSACNS